MHHYSQDTATCLSGICIAIVKTLLNVWAEICLAFVKSMLICLNGICVATVKTMLYTWAEYTSLQSRHSYMSERNMHRYSQDTAECLSGICVAIVICLDYSLRTSIDKIRENDFELTKKRSRSYPAKTITDADYVDDIAILANTPNQAETLLLRLERVAASIGLHVNAHILNICALIKQATFPH